MEDFDQVTVYAVFREGSPGQALAAGLWRWLNVLGDDGLPSAGGVPVYFRSQLDADGRVTPALSAPERGRAMNFAVLFIDAGWLLDPRWRAAAGALVDPPDTEVLVIPLVPNASSAHPRLASAQQVAVFPTADGDLQVPLQRAVTQTLVRRVRARLGLPERKPTVFLSHAKADGRQAALALRAAVLAYGQLDVFFDESDLLWGSPHWAEQLREGVLQGSDGMIVLETDVYASRPWCRAEVELARVPRRVGTGKVDGHVWGVLPTVVLGRPGARWSKVLPELGNVPRLGCEGDFATAALDRLMREILLSSVHRLRARAVASARPEPCEVLTFTPSPETVRGVRAKVRRRADIVYPGDGLYRFEVPRLLAGDASAARGRVCLHPYPDWVSWGSAGAPRLTDDVLVAVSVSESPDRGRKGVGAVHENATLTRLTQELVRAGARVLYGGILVNQGGGADNKLQPIVDAVVAHARSAVAGEGLPPRPPLVNVQALPFYRSVDDATRAELFGVVQFVFVDPPSWRGAAAQEAPEVGFVSYEAATALREMRRLMARGTPLDGAGRPASDGEDALPATTLRVALGGKVEGYKGVLPGIAEEYLEDREAGRPVLVNARFGGCAGRIADYLLGGELAPELTLAWASQQSFYGGLLGVVPADEVNARWDALQARLDADRATLQAGGSIVPSLDRDGLERLMRTESDAALVVGVLGVARACSDAGA